MDEIVHSGGCELYCPPPRLSISPLGHHQMAKLTRRRFARIRWAKRRPDSCDRVRTFYYQSHNCLALIVGKKSAKKLLTAVLGVVSGNQFCAYRYQTPGFFQLL